MKRMAISLLITVSILFLMAGCSNDTEDGTIKGESKKEGIFPLTGLEGKGIDNRMVGVMVNNHPKARPQKGVSNADLVFELLTEGNITRLLAFYQSEYPEVVGPVRSAREYYIDLASRYDAIYVHHGAADHIDDMIETRGIDRINGSKHDDDGVLFKRDNTRKAPHNSYLQFQQVGDIASEKGYEQIKKYEELPFLTNDEVKHIAGEEALHTQITYSNNPSTTVSYQYVEEDDSYIRLNDGEQTVEQDTEKPIELDNIFIVEATHEQIDDEGRRAIDLNSGGNAYLLQKGKVQKLTWESRDGRILPIQDGEVVGFIPGKTWINVVPTNPGLEQCVGISND